MSLYIDGNADDNHEMTSYMSGLDYKLGIRYTSWMTKIINLA